jgi:aldehyde dehydrogenase (NAD+)
MTISQIINQSRLAQIEWASNPAARSAALSAIAANIAAEKEKLIESMVSEVHKPISEARGECARAIAILQYFSSAVLDPDGNSYPTSAPNLILSMRRPYGVAGLITPWNFPIAIPIWKAAPALAAGNAVVLKPSEFANETALLMAEIMNKSLPENIFTVVSGGSNVGADLVSLADVISFTGSVHVGKLVVAKAAELGKPVQAEMGGHNPAIILPDADLNLLASSIQVGAFSYSGQKCTATRRIIVVGNESRKKEVVDVLVSATDKLVAGDPHDERTVIGPLIHSDSYKNYVNAINSANSSGRLIVGGKIDTTGTNLPSATLTDGLAFDHYLMCNEVFAPIAHVASVKSAKEAISLANAVKYGLTASIHTADLQAALDLSRSLQTGMVKINAPTAGVDFHAPFGGDKDSSYGMREQGKAALDFYSHTKTVTFNAGQTKFA